MGDVCIDFVNFQHTSFVFEILCRHLASFSKEEGQTRQKIDKQKSVMGEGAHDTSFIFNLDFTVLFIIQFLT